MAVNGVDFVSSFFALLFHIGETLTQFEQCRVAKSLRYVGISEYC